MSSGGGGGSAKGVFSVLAFVGFIVAIIIAFTAFPLPSLKLPNADNFVGSTTTSTMKFGNGMFPRVAPPGNTGGNFANIPISNSNSNTPISSASPQAIDVPPGFTLQQLSPHFRKVRLASVYPGGIEKNGQITLSASFSGNERITVTGWRVEGKRGGSPFIPKAVQTYDALGLAPEVNIVMKSGDSLYLYAYGQSAIGKNLRLNKCLGYLPVMNEFTPSLPWTCPYVDRSEITNFTGQCQNYILSLGGCRAPDMSDIRIPQNDDACRTFLGTLNYRGCVERHGADKDFLQNQIYAWISFISLDLYHDKARLLDEKGLLVDVYEY